MLKVLAVMGSPRSRGNTYKVTKMVEERMKKMGDVEFEYLFLKDLALRTCLGCRACMDRGEECCPLKDDRAMVEEKILGADGVIFASPTYVGNVSGLMKNFIDRFAYVCHRPKFFKSAMAITTSGGGGAGFMLIAFSIALSTWGFKVVHKLGAITHEHPERYTPKDRAVQEAAMVKKVDMAAKKFYGSLSSNPPKPGIISMAQFLYVKQAHSRDDPASADYRYWKSHGWYENDACYFYDPEAGVLKRSLAVAASKLFGLVAK